MNNYKTGVLIKNLRTQKGITQKELAEKLNCTDKAISRWETGKGFPETSLLIPLANELDISVNELLSGEKIEKEKLIDNSNEVIVNTIKESNKAISNLGIVISAVFVIVQLAILYAVPLTAGPGDEMGLIFFFVLGTFINSISMGFIKSKFKFLAPLVASILFIPSAFLSYSIYPFDMEECAIYMLVFFVVSLLGLLPGILIKLIAKLIKKSKTK